MKIEMGLMIFSLYNNENKNTTSVYLLSIVRTVTIVKVKGYDMRGNDLGKLFVELLRGVY